MGNTHFCPLGHTAYHADVVEDAGVDVQDPVMKGAWYGGQGELINLSLWFPGLPIQD